MLQGSLVDPHPVGPWIGFLFNLEPTLLLWGECIQISNLSDWQCSDPQVDGSSPMVADLFLRTSSTSSTYSLLMGICQTLKHSVTCWWGLEELWSTRCRSLGRYHLRSAAWMSTVLQDKEPGRHLETSHSILSTDCPCWVSKPFKQKGQN